MINTETCIRVCIDDVEEIRIDPIEDAFNGGKERYIIVTTIHDETYILRVKSSNAEKLEFLARPEVEDDWLTPKVYNGRPMEEDQEPQT